MRTTAFRLLVALVVVSAWFGVPPSADAQPAPPHAPYADLAIPNGHFFTQAAPGQRGAGYRVADEAGIPFWTEFQRHGGLERLGYPLTRRFIWQNRVVQLFQFGALRWLGEESDIVPAAQIGRPPAAASRAEPPPYSIGDAAKYPWSGWWWPSNNLAGGPRLFDIGGPLWKYDRLVESLGYPNPATREWEASTLVFAGLQWAGHCNGWAAASILEPEPVEDQIVNGIHFSVADQKGLLTSYHFANSAQWAIGSEEEYLTPGDFHRWLLYWIGRERKGMIFTFRLVGEEVWSYPAFKYESVWGPDAIEPDLWHVRTVVWLVDNEVPAGYIGARPWPGPDGKVFDYTIRGTPENPVGGDWGPANRGGLGKPYMVWYPDPKKRNVERQLASPELDYDLIRKIISGRV